MRISMKYRLRWIPGLATGAIAVAIGTFVHGWYTGHWSGLVGELPIRAAIMMPSFVLIYPWISSSEKFRAKK